MPDQLTLRIGGQEVQVPADVSVLAALQAAGVVALRRSLGGQPRGALCGMGSCFECRALVDGRAVRTCLTPAREGMHIEVLDGEHAQ